MDAEDIAARLRGVFEVPARSAINDAIALISIAVQEYLQDAAHSPIAQSVVILEGQLLDVYENLVDHTSVPHLEAFLSVLFALRPVLPASSLISWFNHLRPALREPYLAPEVKRNLQSLLASALDESAHAAESRSREFRRQLLQLYIVDSSENKLSAEDIVEGAVQPSAEALIAATWKENLERILELDLLTSPDDAFALLNALFAEPNARHPLMALVLRVFATNSSPSLVVSLSRSTFLDSLFTSLLVDKSTALFQREMVAQLIIMPMMAVYAPVRLRELLPSILATLSRAICWKIRSSKKKETDENGEAGATDVPAFVGTPLQKDVFVENDDPGPYAALNEPSSPTPELNWVILEKDQVDDQMSIDAYPLFTFVYGLFPCNTIAFLRRPVARLQELGFHSPLGVSWTYLLDENEIRTKSTALVRSHAFHPDVLFRDAQSELADPHSWGSQRSPSTDSVARLVASCIRLDYSYHGVKDPKELVRAALEREGEPYSAPPDPNTSLSLRSLLTSPPSASSSSRLTERGPRRESQGDSEMDLMWSTPRARIRDRLPPSVSGGHPLTPGFEASTSGGMHSSSSTSSTYSYSYPHSASYTSPHYRSTSQPETPLLLSHTYTTSASLLPSTSTSTSVEPQLHSADISREVSQSSIESHPPPLTTSASMQGFVPHTHMHLPPPAPTSAPPFVRHSPLSHPSPLSLSSMPLPEVSPEGSPEDDHPPNPLPAEEHQEGEDEEATTPITSEPPSARATLSPDPSMTPPPQMLAGDDYIASASGLHDIPSASPLEMSRSTSGTTSPSGTLPAMPSTSMPMLASVSAPTTRSASGSTSTSLSARPTPAPLLSPHASVSPSPSPSASTESKRALETLHKENARLRDLNLLLLWMGEQSKRHVERLARDRIVSTGEEMERQNLHNRLREYKRRLTSLQAEIATVKREAEIKSKRSKQWVDELQDKLREFRKEKISWTNEAVMLRGQVKDAKALMDARQELLDDTRHAHDSLRTEMEYMKPKIAQLESLEKQLESFRKQLSADDSEEMKKLKEDSKTLRDTQEAMEKLRQLVASLEHANSELQNMTSESTAEAQRLRSRMVAARTNSDSQLRTGSRSPTQRKRPLSQSFSASAAAVAFRHSTSTPIPPTSDEAYEKLEQENFELKEDVESLTMMVEKLRNEVERSRIRLAQAQAQVQQIQAAKAEAEAQARARARAEESDDASTTPSARPSQSMSSRRKSFGFLTPSGSKSSPSPATVSSLELPPLRRV